MSSVCHLAQGSKEQRNPALLLDFDDSCRDDIPCVERILQRNSGCLQIVDMHLHLHLDVAKKQAAFQVF